MIYISPDRKYINMFVPRRIWHLTQSDKFIFNGRELRCADAIDFSHTMAISLHFFNRTRVNLSTQVLKKKYGANYARYIEWAKSINMIELVSNHYKGRFSRQYQISDEVMQDLMRYKMRNRRLMRMYSKLSSELLSQRLIDDSDPVRRQHALLAKDMSKFTIDMQLAKEIIQQEQLDESKRSHLEWIMDSINNKQFFWSSDEYGRMHTNFTVLKKCIRNGAITCSGQPIDEVDIVNSQPLFLTILMRKHGVLDNFRDFVLDVRNGQMYDQISKYSGVTRSRAKKLCFTVLYGKNNDSNENKIFRGIYPSVWQWLKKIKIEQKNYRFVAHELQRMEAEWMFNRLMPELRQRIPDTAFFTVHDSVFFPMDKRREVVRIFRKCMAELMMEEGQYITQYEELHTEETEGIRT